jgi:hypothetical protein
MTSIGKLPPMRGRDVPSKPHAGDPFFDLGQGAGVTVEYDEYKPILSTWIAANEAWRRKMPDSQGAQR